MYYGTGNGSVIHVTGGSGGTVTVTDSVSSQDGVLSVSIPVSGAQTIGISYVSGPSFYIDGVVHYAGDENNGITLHACGHYGWTADSSDWNQIGFSGFPSFPSNASLATAFALGIFLGINDCQQVNAATFQSNIESLINNLQMYSPLGSIPLLIIIPYQPNVTVVDSGGWNAYVTALQNVAAAYPGSTVVNLSALMPPVISGGSLYVDNVHPSNSGHALIGQYVANAMSLGVSDLAGAVEAPSVTATVHASDFAGAVESATILAFMSVADSAGQAETGSLTNLVSFRDYAGAVESFGVVPVLPPLDYPAIVLMAAAYTGSN
jgi:hypothetical protein